MSDKEYRAEQIAAIAREIERLDLVKVVRCRDCKYATVTINNECKYCEMFWSPDIDGYGANPQVCLPGDFFCAWGERR